MLSVAVSEVSRAGTLLCNQATLQHYTEILEREKEGEVESVEENHQKDYKKNPQQTTMRFLELLTD